MAGLTRSPRSYCIRKGHASPAPRQPGSIFGELSGNELPI